MRNEHPIPGNGARGDPKVVEPNADIACHWWPDMTNVWTPVGWPDHLFRFNVLYDGAILAYPVVSPVGETKPHMQPYADQGVQLTFIPSPSPYVGLGALNLATHGYAEATFPYAGREPRIGNQGWNDTPAPVLWTDWRREGMVLRQEVFAHVLGGLDVQAGIEPLFCWCRLSIRDVEADSPFGTYGFLIILNGAHTSSGGGGGVLHVHPDRLAYPRDLGLHPSADENGQGLALVEPNGRLRLAVTGGRVSELSFLPRDGNDPSNLLYVGLPAERGAHADLLVPFLPVESADAAAEMELGRDGALAQANRYWSRVPATAAEVVTPERLANDAIRHSLKLVRLCTETNPTTGQPTFLTGSLNYEQLWPTPTSLYVHMLLDVLGHHDFVEKHLEVFRQTQGTRLPPGTGRSDPDGAANYYERHPGYYAAPESVAVIDWVSDHGAILHTVCNHALVTDDRAFVDRWLDSILKACDFINDARAITGHGGVQGLLPMGVDTDSQRQMQSVWADGWCHLGLATAVRLLRRIRHPRVERLAEEVRRYREIFVAAIREHTERNPVWTDADGREHHYVPGAFAGAVPGFGEMIYLDTGPLFCVFAGLLEADDPLMASTRRFFRKRPAVDSYRGYYTAPPRLIHENSSCEPCYSWNIFHSHQLGDRDRYLEGMYSLFAGGLSRQTYISSEMRGGVSGNVFSASPATYLARLAVIDDRISADEELHLLRLCPLAWLREDTETRFVNVPTTFGPVTLSFRLAEGGKRLDLSFEPSFRHRPRQVVLHVPPKAGIAHVVVNGRMMDAEPGVTLTIR